MKSDRTGKLTTPKDIRTELARLYRSSKKGDIAPGDASKLAHILSIILKSIEVHELEERIIKLENKS